VLLPVSAVKITDDHLFRPGIEAVHVHIDTIRVGAGCIEGLDAADLAEGMPGHPGVEGVAL